MPTYVYEAVDSRGQRVRSEIEAANEDEAQTKVRGLGYLVTELKVKGGKTRGKASSAATPTGKKKTATIGNKVRPKMLTTLTRQLATLINAGLPIVRSLRICEELNKPGVLKNNLIDMTEDVEGGMPLSEAMAKHPKTYDKLYVNITRAGEAGGVLDQMLERLATFMEKSQKLKKQVISALIYPIAVIIVAGLILYLIITFIVPKFTVMFQDMKAGELPVPTKVLIAMSSKFGEYWYLVLLIPFALFVIYRLIGSSHSGKRALDIIKMHVPVFGTIMRKSVLSRFLRTLGVLITSGVPLLEALSIVREATGNVVISDAIGKIHDSVREGDDIAGPMDQTGICDRMVVNMVAVGEETGELDKMLMRVADTYDDDVDAMVGGLMSLLEPIIIVVLGLAVAFIVISLFLPLINLMSSISDSTG